MRARQPAKSIFFLEHVPRRDTTARRDTRSQHRTFMPLRRRHLWASLRSTIISTVYAT